MSVNINVAVRMRPLIEREIKNNLPKHWKIDTLSSVCSTASNTQSYKFDRVFKPGEDNEQIYTEFCSPIIKSVVDGFNGTIFAYGQTSSGKTYTLMGNDQGTKRKEDSENEKGIIHYTTEDIFSLINDMTERDFLIRVSFMEIYNEEIYDLLDTKNESLKLGTDESGLIKVNGLTSPTVQRPEQLLEYIKQGNRNRKTAETQMNDKSSRSHSIFQVIIESCLRGVEDSAVTVSQFNLVDLAGSERVRQTKVKGQQFQESIKINLSLLTLGSVIHQLSENEPFIRYRDSKLTRILQNSLGGNAKTAIICNITPISKEDTRSTLQFATRAKRIQNKPQINEVVTDQTLLRRFASQIKQLTQELEDLKKATVQDKQKDQEDTCLLKIKSLQQQFVFQQPIVKCPRTARRETWGGCMRNKNFLAPSSIPLFQPSISTRNLASGDDHSHGSRKSGPPAYLTSTPLEDEKFSFDFTRPSLRSTNLHSVQEESEDTEFTETPSTIKSLLNDEYSTIHVSRRSDIQSTGSIYDGLTTKDLIERIEYLENDRREWKRNHKELEDFTTIERQVIRASVKNSSDFKDLTTDDTCNISVSLNTCEKNCDLTKQQVDILNDKIRIQKLKIEGLQEEVILYKNDSKTGIDKTLTDSCDSTCQTSIIAQSNDTECQTSLVTESNDTECQTSLIVHLNAAECQTSFLGNYTSVQLPSTPDIDCQTCMIEKANSEKNGDDYDILKEEIQVQEQIIDHLQQELDSLKNKLHCTRDYLNADCQTSFSESASLQHEICTCDQDTSSTDLISNDLLETACQTSFLESVAHEKKTIFDSSSQTSFVETPPQSDMFMHHVCTCDQDTSSKNLEVSIPKNLHEEIPAMSDLIVTGSYVYGNMKTYMSEIMLEGVNQPAKSGSTEEQIALEVTFVKSLLVLLDSYARNVTESSDYFKSLLSEKMYEVSSMQQRVDQAENELKKKCDEVAILEASTSDLKNKFLAVLKRFEIPFHQGEDKYSMILQESKTLKDLTCLKKVADRIESAIGDLSAKLADSEKQVRIAIEKVDVAKLSGEMSSKDLEREIEELKCQVENLEKSKTNLESEMKSMTEDFKNEKKIWMSKTKDCVREIEDKCDKMLVSQENKHLDQLCDREQKHLEEREKELEEYKAQLSKYMLDHNKTVESLKSQHAKQLAETEAELSTVRSKSMAKTDDIMKLKDHMMTLESGNMRMRHKYSLLVAKLKQTQQNKKDQATQTEFARAVQKDAGSQTRLLKQDSSTCSTCLNAAAQPSQSCPKLEFELERTKAKVMSLTTNNERLVQKVREQEQELRTKLILLKNCRCGHFPMPISKSIEQQAEKAKNLIAEERLSRAPESDEEILKKPVVLKAIQDARQYERLKYTSIASGPQNEVANFYYKHELNKATSKIQQLEKELQKRSRSRNPRSVSPGRKSNTENQRTVEFHQPKKSPPKAPRKPAEFHKNPFAPHQETNMIFNKEGNDLENWKPTKKDSDCKQQ